MYYLEHKVDIGYIPSLRSLTTKAYTAKGVGYEVEEIPRAGEEVSVRCV
jgi:hypothetical protein